MTPTSGAPERPPPGLAAAAPPRLIDSHCHLDAPAFAADRCAVLARSRAAGVTDVVVPGVTARGWGAALELCRADAGLHPALGLHPLFLPHEPQRDLAELERRLGDGEAVAVGEIGLDRYPDDVDRAAQQRLFEAQLVIARDAGLPVLLHVRKAHDAVLEALARIRVRGGIAHAYNGSAEQAARYAGLGFVLGFGGTLTYPGARRLHALAACLPLDWLALETDAPDLSGAAHHGERNSPEYLPEVLAQMAALRDSAAADIAAATTANVTRVLGLD